MKILRVALPLPKNCVFDYLPVPSSDQQPQAGMRVRVPFGSRVLLGIIVEVVAFSTHDSSKLKAALQYFDLEPLLSAGCIALGQRASAYYHEPIGRVLNSTLPRYLKQEIVSDTLLPEQLKLTPEGLQQLNAQSRAKKQQALLAAVAKSPQGIARSELMVQNFSAAMIRELIKKSWLAVVKVAAPETVTPSQLCSPDFELNVEQRAAVDAIRAQSTFHAFLLEGVTGSGKTEVYFQVIAEKLLAGFQVLVLVPEIGLTPQAVARFQSRFKVSLTLYHSGLSDRQRAQAWVLASRGLAKIVIGTRSAVFIPLKNPGLIILDEEHDLSFKQQSGWRYSARDCAILRGQIERLPVVLGTATPCLETLHNVARGKYQRLQLTQRAGDARMPTVNIINLCAARLEEGLSHRLIDTMRDHLQKGHQVLLFLNRRGYAPILFCHECAWMVSCERCDAKMVVHRRPERLVCHHCGAVRKPPTHCPQCQQANFYAVGLGTERLEQTLQQLFPEYKTLRIDRDTIASRKALGEALSQIHNGSAQIILGTQMLAKGHHFPNVTLVAIVDADSGLMSADYRAVERLGQLLVQVGGRAGRSERQGEVILQTHFPDHPLLHTLLKKGYRTFAETLMKERQAACLPPFTYQAVLHADGLQAEVPTRFLQHVKDQLNDASVTEVNVLGPIPASMQRKAGRFRAQLLLQSANRKQLQTMLSRVEAVLVSLRSPKYLQWHLDVDPQEAH